MDKSKLAQLDELHCSGKLYELAEELKPYLAAGDLDARCLNTSFSIDPNETGEMLDARGVSEIIELAKLWHPPSLRILAWKHWFGDEVPKDGDKFLLYLAASALLGDSTAISDLGEQIELLTNDDSFRSRLSHLVE
jgi:hypothetical protein